MRRKKKWSHPAGFTLIELVIVLTILAILAAVAIPAFQNLTAQARDAAVQGAVGGMRSAVALYYAGELVAGRAGAYPIATQMMDQTETGGTGPKVLEQGETPDNPWCVGQTGGSHCTGNKDGVAEGASTNRAIATSSSVGWLYSSSTGLIYANTSASSSAAKENSF